MATCKSCGAEIIWIETRRGMKHPVDAKPETRWIEKEVPGQYNDGMSAQYMWVLMDTFISHFATCPQSKQWSDKGGNK